MAAELIKVVRRVKPALNLKVKKSSFPLKTPALTSVHSSLKCAETSDRCNVLLKAPQNLKKPAEGSKIFPEMLQPVHRFESLRNYLNPYRSHVLLLGMIDRAWKLNIKTDVLNTLKEWLVVDALQKKGVTGYKQRMGQNAAVCTLIRICSDVQDRKFYLALLLFLKKIDFKQDNTVTNLMFDCLAHNGWHDLVKVNYMAFSRSGFTFRIYTLLNLIVSALEMKDLEFADNMMDDLIKMMGNYRIVSYSKIAMMTKVMDSLVGYGEEAGILVKKVLECFQVVPELSISDMDSIVDWLRRWVTP